MDSTYVTVDKAAGYYQYTIDGERVSQEEFDRCLILYFNEWIKTNQPEPQSIRNEDMAKVLDNLINGPEDKELRL